MNQMEGITYAFVAPERMFGPYASARVTDAVLASIGATLVYVAGSLLLLALPFRLDRLSGRRLPAAARREGLQEGEQSESPFHSRQVQHIEQGAV